MPLDSSGSRKHDDRPMLAQFLTQARRLRPTRNFTWSSDCSERSRFHSRQNSSVAASCVANRLEYTYPVPKRPSMGIFHVQPELMAMAEVNGSTPLASSSWGTAVAT